MFLFDIPYSYRSRPVLLNLDQKDLFESSRVRPCEKLCRVSCAKLLFLLPVI